MVKFWLVENPTVGSHASLAESISCRAESIFSIVRRISVLLATAQSRQSLKVHTAGKLEEGGAVTISGEIESAGNDNPSAAEALSGIKKPAPRMSKFLFIMELIMKPEVVFKQYAMVEFHLQT